MEQQLTDQATEPEKGQAPEKARGQEKTREQELQEAIERVYRAYGSDLPAFERDVQKELVKRA
jgi:hypothetical protein